MARPDDGTGSLTRKFLADNNCMRKKGDTYTHLFMNNGRAYVSPALMDHFQEAVASDLRVGNIISPISEVRTIVCPFYLDWDIEAPVPTLSLECVDQFARTANAQAQKFFPPGHSALKCVVCDKTGEASVATTATTAATALGIPAVTYKHGLHMHWPDVLVKANEALRMRASILSALERIDWQPLLGTPTVDWDTVLDESVYKSDDKCGGLRLVGACKAVKCPTCKGKDVSNCAACFYQGTVPDQRYYKLCRVFRGAEVDEETFQSYTNNPTRFVRATTVRSHATEISQGWAAYPGCPMHAEKTKRGTKRPAGIEARFVCTDVSSAKSDVIRKLLVKFSDNYAASSFRVMFDGTSYKVILRGDGARWCRNIRDFHNGQNVYMEISCKQRGIYWAKMRCFCKCKVPKRPGQTLLCSKYVSQGQEKYLDASDAAVLFDTAAPKQHKA